ncbi:phosphotransferase [Bacteroides ihuae]|uniref:phosphotransferase n=1 Tax=Bacteroides ihuae TaxID=1852362 RepID=UPI0008DA5D8D|nr:phosphotransferase [Bacteroides ihuae]
MEIEVKGHSGCQINIVREANELFVYKSSRDPKYLVRLLMQAEKQQQAAKFEYQHIRVPHIFDVSHTSEMVNVKMEYVYSKNFIEYFELAGFEQISYLVKALLLFLEKELKESPIGELNSEIVADKFDDVCDKVLANALLRDDEDIKSLLERTKTIFNTINTIIYIPLGICHGDLTFSNILFNGNNYYLIDFLDSFVESPLLDIVKIRQDSAYLWSQLMYIHEFDKIRLHVISRKIDNEIDRYFSRYDWYREYYKIFQLMNFWRILQYAHEEKIISYLKNVIKSILNEF